MVQDCSTLPNGVVNYLLHRFHIDFNSSIVCACVKQVEVYILKPCFVYKLIRKGVLCSRLTILIVTVGRW